MRYTRQVSSQHTAFESMTSAEWTGWKGVLAGIVSRLGLGSSLARRPASETPAFTMAVIGLAAKMAKADGVAVEVEAQAFERCFHVPHEEMAASRRLFALAARDIAGFDAYASRISGMLGNDRDRLKQVLECLFHIATADHLMHTGEARFLARVSEIFGFSEMELQAISALFVHDPVSPYTILGTSPGIADAELKATYLRLVKENHPDRLSANGATREMIVVADRKLAVINAAYEQIVARRAAAATLASGDRP